MKEIFSYFKFKNYFISINYKNKTKKQLMKLLEKQNKVINDYLNIQVCLFI